MNGAQGNGPPDRPGKRGSILGKIFGIKASKAERTEARPSEATEQHRAEPVPAPAPAPSPAIDLEPIPQANLRPQLSWLAESVSRRPNEKIPASEARQCRQLLRTIYAANIYVAELGYVPPVSVGVVKERHRRGQGAVSDLHRVVNGWANAKEQWSEREWALVQEIHQAVQHVGVIPLELQVE